MYSCNIEEMLRSVCLCYLYTNTLIKEGAAATICCAKSVETYSYKHKFGTFGNSKLFVKQSPRKLSALGGGRAFIQQLWDFVDENVLLHFFYIHVALSTIIFMQIISIVDYTGGGGHSQVRMLHNAPPHYIDKWGS